MKIYSRRGKKIMISKNKRYIRQNRFSFVWNEVRAAMDIDANWENEIKIVLENQMIQILSEEITKNQKH